jgi:hypothetical protein
MSLAVPYILTAAAAAAPGRQVVVAPVREFSLDEMVASQPGAARDLIRTIARRGAGVRLTPLPTPAPLIARKELEDSATAEWWRRLNPVRIQAAAARGVRGFRHDLMLALALPDVFA